MQPEMVLAHLAEAEHHVASEEQHIARQHSLIAELERSEKTPGQVRGHTGVDRQSATRADQCRLGQKRGWRPVGDSNPCCRRERAVSWASRRTGPRTRVARPAALFNRA